MLTMTLTKIIALDEGERFLMQSKSTFLEFLRGIHRYKFGLPKKFSGAKLFGANDVISIEHVLCS